MILKNLVLCKQKYQKQLQFEQLVAPKNHKIYHYFDPLNLKLFKS